MTVVVVTGASAGVGRAIVRRFAEPGVSMGLVARGAKRLEAAAEDVRRAGGEALAIPLDTSDADAVEAAAARFERELGPIDIWINLAMVTIMAPIIETTPAEYARVTNVTYLGFVHGTLAALKRMKPRDRGTIVQIGSALGYRSIPLQSAYCAAKHAVNGFTDSLRCELIHDRSNVNVTTVQLPAVNTPQFDWSRSKMPRRSQPLPPIFEPELIADAVHHAAHHPQREYWLGYPAWKAILGERLAPGVADRVLANEAWDGQMTDEPRREGRPDNLFDPVEGGDSDNWAARGRFTSRASDRSPMIWAGEHKSEIAIRGGAIALGVLGLAAAALIAGRAGRGIARRR